MIRFLNSYSPDEASSYKQLIEDSIQQLPYSLSTPVEKTFRCIEEQQYGKAMNLMLDFFEITIPYTSFLFLRLLQPERQTPQVQKVLEAYVNRIDLKRPLSLGDWLNDLFNPLLQTAFQYLPANVLAQSFQQHLFDKRKNILLGDKRTPSIVQIRNEYRGHSTTLSEQIYRDVVAQLEPRLLRFLSALHPLTDCTFDIQTGRYAIHSNDDAWHIDLYPLVFTNQNDYRYIFHTLKDEQAGFLSSNENAVTLITDELNDAIDQDLQQIVPSFDIAKDLNWKEVKLFMQRESGRFLDRIYAEKKYNRELFVEREKLTATLHRFWDSPATLFPLMGEAGQGKTNQLCYWTEQLIAADEPVVIFNSALFADNTLDNLLKQIFEYNYRKDIFRLLDAIHQKAVANNQQVYFFFDAINECLKYAEAASDLDGPLALYQAITHLFCQERYTHFKVLATCRFYTWKNLILPHIDTNNKFLYYSEEEDTAVRGFDREETERAYRIYQQLYQMHTSYEQLDRRVTLRLKDPLILKFASANFLGSQLPTAPERYTSLALFEQMMDCIGNSYAGNYQRKILEQMADYILDSYLNGQPIDGISVEELRMAFQDNGAALSPLANLIYKKDGISIAYAELLNKADRPILKEVRRADRQGERTYIQFVYERFLEYVMGDALVRKGHRSQEPGRPLPATFFADILQKVRPNVVLMGALRNALIQDGVHCQDFSSIQDLEAQWSEDYTVLSLVTETMDTMIRENYENELFLLLDQLLDAGGNDSEYINAFNEVVRKIQTNEADGTVIAEHKRLSALLTPTIRQKKLASVSIVNGLLLTDYFNEQLYEHDTFQLLWKVMRDPIYDIRNDVCMYTYYLSYKKHTLDYTPLEHNLTVQIIKEMYGNIKKKGLLRNFLGKKARTQAMMYVETASRLCVLMLLDHTRIQEPRSQQIVSDMLEELRSIFRYLTGNFYLVRLFMPIFQIAMKRQITFQSDYVNNAVEYSTFWEKETFRGIEYQGRSWQPADVNELMSFAYHYQRFGYKNPSEECRSEEERFRRLHPQILSAYRSGDSFSYFVLERMLVIMGSSRWENIAPIAEAFFSDDFRQTPWFDYGQMSMLYILYQVACYSPEMVPQLQEIYAKEAVDWTCRNKGLFKGRKSDRANTVGLYKRNVMCWYANVYCAHSGDNVPQEGDERAVPIFYDLIDKAIQDNDKELLFHLIENISELITDMGYIHTALQLLKHILVQYDTQEKVDRLNGVVLQRGGIYQYDLVKLVGNVFSTAKNYYAEEIDAFIKKEIVGLSFPGVGVYREEILNYHPSGETLSDLLTHRFGNFLMWALINIPAADDFATEAIAASTKTSDSFSWYEQGVRIFVKHFFGVKI